MSLKGIPASNGLGLADALIIADYVLDVSEDLISHEDSCKELNRFKKALGLAHEQLQALYESTKGRLGNKAEIIQAQKAMLDDPVLEDDIQSKITVELFGAEYAVKTVLDEHIDVISAVDDEYIRERAADLEDIKIRILHNLAGRPIGLSVDRDAVLVCSMLTPSQTANLNPKYVKGIICESGGVTAHAAIIARNLEIPAVMGCKGAMNAFTEGDLLFVNGSKGEAYAVCDPNEIANLRKQIEKSLSAKNELISLKDVPSATSDGKPVALYANIGSAEEVKQAIKYGGDGVGLFRTEYLYMESKQPPSEDTQFNIYKKTVEQLPGKNVVIRTFDIGGDKEVPCLDIPKEDNPFLGWRAVRIGLEETGLLKTQLRALLRASAYGSIKIMIPMISSVSEVRAVKKIFEAVKDELKQSEIAFDEQTELGIMVEVPSAAVCADLLVHESDFFSIGTNDLIQYTLAVDRGNDKVTSYYDFYNPAVLRLVKQTIDASHEAGKTTGMCGEAAGDVVATILLLGLGLDSFSMSPSILPKVKKIITLVDMAFAQSTAKTALTMATGEEIKQFLTDKLIELGLDYLILL